MRPQLIQFALGAGVAAIVMAPVQLALSATPQRVALRDAPGDVVARGKRVSDRNDVDIRSVTVKRPTQKKVVVVVATAAPLRPDTTVTFRYVSPDGFDEMFIDATVTSRRVGSRLCGRRRHPWAVATGDASLTGRRLTLGLDTRKSNSYLEWYPRFQWMVTVTSPDGTFLGVRDHAPNQVDAIVNPRYSAFP